MLKAEALSKCSGAPVKSHLIQVYWRRWVSLETVMIELNCTAANVELHFNQYQFYHVPSKRRIFNGRVEYYLGG